ncbi:DUF4422 domain-containing protein [Gemelliphila palaticanis]|uniref:DUF4422 domain-containing protein n=1 Tax=Gemelliphila palaticanis TaxID=81950 RepID=A0ABX2T239_9BACL|nr:DUF4422 domain-containing protein [Gemella palaticanis]MBF0715599.1 DUF4422 domain-containing protein [Gemella palaticanis]NYS47529.1 DUF4422 domain-containing protein [Gemella palaticanis]
MNDLKILIATHKNFNVPKNSIYIPINVGADINNIHSDYLKDNVGENISNLNPYFSELTALYWAWKNLNCDYLGLVHYRRYFGKKDAKYKENISLEKLIIDLSDIEPFLSRDTIIVPKYRKYYIETLYSHYSNTLDGSHLDITRNILLEMYPDYINSYDFIMKQTKGHMFNMFISSKELSDGYCEWLFPILFELQNRLDISKLTSFEARLFGRVSEILFNVWLDKNKIKTVELPLLDAFKINWIKKGSAFLMAKFFKKKYKRSF